MIQTRALHVLTLASVLMSALCWNTPAGEDGFGTGLAVLGDVNGDGVDDFAVSDPYREDAEKGKGWIAAICGKKRVLLWETWGDPDTDAIGNALFPVGDVNKDGKSDLAQWSWWGKPLTVLSGADGEELLSFPGRSVTFAGDVDGDGHGDLLVAGKVELPEGAKLATLAVIRSGANGEVIKELTAPILDQRMIRTVATRDVDGDGKPDWGVHTGHSLVFFRGKDGSAIKTEPSGRRLALGVPCSSSTGPLVTARVVGESLMLEFAKSQGKTPNGDEQQPQAVELRKPSAMEMPSGLWIECLGDVDDDGVDDFLVGLNSGRIHWEIQGGLGVWSGAKARLIWSYRKPSEICETRMMVISDLDGDGVMDVLVSGSQAPGAAPITGWVEARSGKTGKTIFQVHLDDFPMS